jgi:predicted metal-dependent hydrolase
LITYPGKETICVHSELLPGYSVITIPKNVRRISIRVGPDRTIRVTLPHGVDPAPYLEKNRRWIAGRALEIERAAASCPDSEHRLLIEGRPCSLTPGSSCTLDLESGAATYTTPAAFREFLTRSLRADLTERILDRSAEMGVSPGRMSIRRQKTRWGSCSSLGNLNFNLRLSALPDHLKEYVVVHELAHLREMRHSPAFWTICARHYPDPKGAESELKRYWVLIERSAPWQVITGK